MSMSLQSRFPLYILIQVWQYGWAVFLISTFIHACKYVSYNIFVCFRSAIIF